MLQMRGIGLWGYPQVCEQAENQADVVPGDG